MDEMRVSIERYEGLGGETDNQPRIKRAVYGNPGGVFDGSARSCGVRLRNIRWEHLFIRYLSGGTYRGCPDCGGVFFEEKVTKDLHIQWATCENLKGTEIPEKARG